MMSRLIAMNMSFCDVWEGIETASPGLLSFATSIATSAPFL